MDRHEFDDLFRLRALNIAQPDICHVGGLSEARKIAAMAENASVGIARHNPLGPLATVAAQLRAEPRFSGVLFCCFSAAAVAEHERARRALVRVRKP